MSDKLSIAETLPFLVSQGSAPTQLFINSFISSFISRFTRASSEPHLAQVFKLSLPEVSSRTDSPVLTPAWNWYSPQELQLNQMRNSYHTGHLKVTRGSSQSQLWLRQEAGLQLLDEQLCTNSQSLTSLDWTFYGINLSWEQIKKNWNQPLMTLSP